MTNDRSSLSLLLVIAVALLIGALVSPAYAAKEAAAETPSSAAAPGGHGSADLAPQPEGQEIPMMTKIWAGMAAVGLMLALGFVALGMKLEMDAKKKGGSSH